MDPPGRELSGGDLDLLLAHQFVALTRVRLADLAVEAPFCPDFQWRDHELLRRIKLLQHASSITASAADNSGALVTNEVGAGARFAAIHFQLLIRDIVQDLSSGKAIGNLEFFPFRF